MQTEKRVIALGFFDGVHLGHGALLRRVGEKALELGAVPAAVTFDTHPENLILKTPAVAPAQLPPGSGGADAPVLRHPGGDRGPL